MVLSALTVNAQSNIYSRIIYHPTDNIACYAIEYGYNNDFMIAGLKEFIKIDSLGEIIFSYHFTNNYCLKTVNQTPDSSFVFFGESYNDTTLKRDLLMLKTDTSGNVIFVKEFDFGQNLQITSADLLADSGFVVCGYVKFTTLPHSKIFVCKLNRNGDMLWKKILNAGSYDNFAVEIKQTSDSICIITGTIRDTTYNDAFLLKMDITGNVVSSNKFDLTSSSHNTNGWGIIYVNNYLYCFMESFGNMLAKVDDSLNVEWCYRYDFNVNYNYFFMFENHPVKMHLSSDSTIYIGAMAEFDTIGNSYNYWDAFLESRADMLETSDKGFILAGNGPMLVTKNPNTIYWPHIGIIKSDSLGNTENCAYLYNVTNKTPQSIILTPIVVSEEIPSVITNNSPVYTIIPIILVDDFGCVDVAGGIKEKNVATVSIFPNPTSGNITIEIPEGSQAISEVKVIDILGNNRLSKRDINNVSLDINLGNLPSGVYIIIITNKNKEVFYKSIVLQNN